MKKNKTNFLIILFFFIGLATLLYPTISDYTNKKLQSQNITNYEEIISKLDKKDYSEELNAAIEYNSKLMKMKYPFVNYNKLSGYENLLNVENGMMGYITIDKIGVELPIYHGTSAKTLNTSVGHLEGSSLPTGTVGTHTVLSAHRGLPSAKLFTNLDKLELGDTFSIEVYDKTYTYEVDQILTVKPDEVSSLKIEEDKEYVTLMTCTPYGINTHRLLVRGHRVESNVRKTYITTKAFKIDKSIIWIFAALPLLLIWFILLVLEPVQKEVDYKTMFVYPKEKIERKKL